MNDFLDAAESVDDLKDNLRDEIDSAVEDGMEDGKRDVRQKVARNDSVATTRLIRRIIVQARMDVARRTDTFSLYTISAPEVYKYVEYGTGTRGAQSGGRSYPRPSNPPPLEPFLTWVTAKGITPNPSGPYNTQVGLANAIRNVIFEKGNYAHPFMRPLWFQIKEYLRNEVGDAMTTAIRRSF